MPPLELYEDGELIFSSRRPARVPAKDLCFSFNHEFHELKHKFLPRANFVEPRHPLRVETLSEKAQSFEYNLYRYFHK